MFIALFVLCLISALILIWVGISEDDPRIVCALLPISAIGLLLIALHNTPTAMDVYQNKTTLKYTIIDGVKTDSVVVWKKEFNN
jgi:hypothetical protein